MCITQQENIQCNGKIEDANVQCPKKTEKNVCRSVTVTNV